METNVWTLKADIHTANLEIRKERRWRRRQMHALRLLNMWCGRKDIFPGLRNKGGAEEASIVASAGGAPALIPPPPLDDTADTAAANTTDKKDKKDPKSKGGDANSLPSSVGGNSGGSRGYEDMTIDELLAHPIAIEFFKVHSGYEESQENIFFLLDVTWLHELELAEELERDRAVRRQIHEAVVSLADHIVKRYIAQGAPQEINISSDSMNAVRKLSAKYSKGMFAKAIYDVKMMTSTDVLSRFKHTPAFFAMCEALDVEMYDMVAVYAKKTFTGRESIGPALSISDDSDNPNADPNADDRDPFSDPEDKKSAEDVESIQTIGVPYRSTFRLMNALADGSYQPNTSKRKVYVAPGLSYPTQESASTSSVSASDHGTSSGDEETTTTTSTSESSSSRRDDELLVSEDPTVRGAKGSRGLKAAAVVFKEKRKKDY